MATSWTSPYPASVVRLRNRRSVVAHTPPAFLRALAPPTLKPGSGAGGGGTAAWCSSSWSVGDTDCPPGVRRALEARRCGTSVCGLTLARWALAHQASVGRWTAAGDHAPIVQRSIANQQQPHHHHQADPWLLPRQPAPRDSVGAKNQATHPSLPSRLATSSSHVPRLSAGRSPVQRSGHSA